MRYALASVGLHAGLIAGAWFAMQFEPPTEAMSAESVAVDILSVESFTNTEASEVVTEATQTLVSAGTDSASEPVPETIEVAEAEPLPEVSETAKPVVAQPIEAVESDELISAEVLTATAEALAPVEGIVPQVVDSAAPAVAEVARPVEAEPLPEVTQAVQPAAEAVEPTDPIKLASLAPEIEEIAETVPVPLPRIEREPVDEPDPIKEKQKEAKKPAEKPKEKPVDKKPAKQASLGNGGAADADSAASKAAGGKGKKNSGGEAAAEDYRGLVRSKVMRAVRQPKGQFSAGEARIMFTLDANGRVLNASLSKSSGDPKVDDAVFAAVKRAAPFPPFPEGTGKSTWSFTFPVLITN